MEPYKYPRTPHLPWSESVTDDDKILQSLIVLENCDDIVVTEKMDGENTNLYTNYLHARSATYSYHESRSWIKRLHSEMGFNIPEGFKLCGENLYAKHSIHYTNLESYFLLFSVWNSEKIALSWDETVEYAQLLGLKTVPVLYRGPWNEKLLRELPDKMDLNKQEGYVVRTAKAISQSEFGKCVGKYVRKGHVQSGGHWMHQELVLNILAEQA